MKSKSRWFALAAVGAFVGWLGNPTEAAAGDKTAPKTASAAPTVMSAPQAQKGIKIWPGSLAWGQSTKKVAAVYDKVVDSDYKEEYKTTSPGVQMERLDAEVAEKKSAFRRSIVAFEKLPTGIDASPLKGEYTYQNKEAMMSVTRNGYTRNFFFINDRLWKIIDVRKLGGSSKWGKDFQESVVKLSKAYGKGRVIQPNPEANRFFAEVDWRDGSSHLRISDRGGKLYLAYEDNQTASNIASMRTTAAPDADAIDPAVAAALSKKKEEPAPEDDKKKKKK